MKNIKEFCKKNKKKIIVTGCIIGGAIIGIVVKDRLGKEFLDVTGKNWITWKSKPGVGFMNMERVKEVLDLNADNTSTFAIVKEGWAGKDSYTCVLLSDDVIKYR